MGVVGGRARGSEATAEKRCLGARYRERGGLRGSECMVEGGVWRLLEWEICFTKFS